MCKKYGYEKTKVKQHFYFEKTIEQDKKTKRHKAVLRDIFGEDEQSEEKKPEDSGFFYLQFQK